MEFAISYASPEEAQNKLETLQSTGSPLTLRRKGSVLYAQGFNSESTRFDVPDYLAGYE